MQSRRGACSIALPCERELQQGRRERALARDSQQGAPPHSPRDPGSGADLSGRVARSGSGEEAQEEDRLVPPAPADLHAEDDQSAAPGAHELRVRAPLALRRGGEGPSRMLGGARLCLAASGYRADDGGVNGELSPVPQRQTVGHHLNASLVPHWDMEIHVREPHVADHARASLLADPRQRSLNRKSP